MSGDGAGRSLVVVGGAGMRARTGAGWVLSGALAACTALGVGVAPGVAQVAPPGFLVTVPSSHDFESTLALLKQSVESENLMVVHEINPQQMLRMVGMRTGGMRQILFFHPRFMRRIIEANPNGGIVPPLKLLVMERPDGSVMVRYHDAKDLLAPYDGLSDVATELDAIVQRVVEAVR